MMVDETQIQGHDADPGRPPRPRPRQRQQGTSGAGARRWGIALLAILGAGVVSCTTTPTDLPTTATSETVPATQTVTSSTSASSPQPSSISGLGDFPEFPEGSLPEPVAASLEAVLDEAVQRFRGVTAAVIVADSGSWSGAAGVDDEGNPMIIDTQLLIASVGKTVTAAQVLRLVDEGRIGLDDPAADYLPPEIAFVDTNGATIRDVLGMRSGIPGQRLVDSQSTYAPLFPAGSKIIYENFNYILLGMIIEHVTGRSLWEAVRSEVLDRPGLEGIVYRIEDGRAGDGWMIESDPASLARWGYELYGGFVLSDDSLRQMTDFKGDWYGLGAIDFSPGTPNVVSAYDVPAIGHGGVEPSYAVRLVAFPQRDVVVAVQAYSGTLENVGIVVGALHDAAQP